MADGQHCAECGTPLPAYWPKGLCAQCAIDGALELTHAASQVRPPDAPAPPASLEPPPSSPPGAPLGAFGDYDLLEEIARGGMGVVYRARQRNLGRLVAVKMILAGSLAGKDFVRRFRTESAAAAILQHPNIVAIHDVGVHEGRHYFSMDYVQGRNLAQLVGQQPLPPAKAAGYVRILAEAIHYAHAQGILHRDLKPSNVLIDANDQPRITDFGLARRLDGESSLTLTGQVLGSPNFMPPEQAGGKRGKVGRPSDVYALGGILYYLLTARAPFQAESLEGTISQVLHVEPVSPRLLNPSLPKDLETIVLKCLEKEPSRRYQTAQELAAELTRFLRQEPIHARPITPPEKLWRWARRKPALAFLVLLLHLVGAAGLAGIVWQWRQAEQERLAGRRQLYITTMNLVQAAWEQNQASRSSQLLEQEQISNWAERGFEWYYWQRQLHAELMTLRGHRAPLLGVAYSPDGQQLVTASSDHTARVYDAASGRFLVALDGHLRPIRSVAYLPDGQRIVTGGWDHAVRIWDAAAGVVELPSLEDHDGPIFTVAVSTNGQRIATASLDGTAKVWDATTRAVVTVFPGHHTYVWAVAFSPDGERVVSGGWTNTARVWDASTGEEQLKLEGHQGAVFAANFSPDGKVIVTGDEDGTVRLWDAATGTPKPPLEGHSGPVFSVVFSPDGQRILSAGDDQTARLWNATNGASLRVIKGHGSRIASAVFSPDGRRIVTAGGGVRYSPLGQPVIPTEGDEPIAKVWDAHEDRASLTLAGHSGPVSSLGFSPDGRWLVSGSFDGTARVWDLGSRGEGIVVGRHDGAVVRSVAFLPDGARIVTGGFDHTARVWDVASRGELYRLEAHADQVFSVAASPRGRWLATAGLDGRVNVSDAATGQLAITFEQHSTAVRAVTFSADDQWVASASDDGVVKIWAPGSGKERLTFRGPGAIWSVAFSHDGRRLVTGGSHERPAVVWDTLNGNRLQSLEGHTAHIHAAAFSPDDRRIVTGSADRTAKLWDAASGQGLLTFRGHRRWVFAVAFSPDGQRIVTGSGDHTIKVWDAASREQVAKWLEEKRTAPVLKPPPPTSR